MNDPSRGGNTLLGAGDPEPYVVRNEAGASAYLIIADHAGQTVPRRLGNLGLTQSELDRHIGWDIGIAGLTGKLAGLLDACAILQNYSRLVIDCNRPLDAPSSIVEASDRTVVPGNLGLDERHKRQRADAIFLPYHARIAAEIDARMRRGRLPILLAMHSFTAEMEGFRRPWHAGVLYGRDPRFAHALLAALRAEPDLLVGDNQPYAVSDLTDYAIPVHGERRGLPHVELEIRQDLIADDEGQRRWAERLARILSAQAPAFTSA